MDYAYHAGGPGTAVIINSVFLPAHGYSDANVSSRMVFKDISIIIDHSIFP